MNMPLSHPLPNLEEVRRVATGQGRLVIEVLQELSGLDTDRFVAALAASAGMKTLSMHDLHALQPAFDVLAFSQATQRSCLPVRNDQELYLVIADPFDAELSDWAMEALPVPFVFRIAHRTDILAYLSRHEESLTAMDGTLSALQSGQTSNAGDIESISLKSISSDSSPVVRLVNSTLYDALKSGVSDVHLETFAGGLVIKYRLDGVLQHVGTIQGVDMADQTLSRIKVMAELDISERRIPQDGRFKLQMQGRDVDFRVSIMPSIFGEDAVLRVLDRKSLAEKTQQLTLSSLGFDPDIIEGVSRMVSEPYGMILVTGPTGSGKTTTLYAALSQVNSGEEKIITIEDPVEYQLPGVLQIPVNEKKGLTFARGLRSILRHDPDKIMVGEIRDGETAQIAVQSALTGHLVFTTVHANNAFDVISRFMHMDVDVYSLVAALNGILAQRLVRTICQHCAVDAEISPALFAKSALSIEDTVGWNFKRGLGCGQCRGTGYRGRKAVAELLILDDEIKEMLVDKQPVRKIRELARVRGMKSLREAALEAVSRGETTLEEINRVTFVS
jgi:general secretion pathway protein E